uniref:MYND-type domain-containing protein n=1 Tax=Bionectria ochroleuca TaxID=29856 RepID=A0A8H7N207_BIOOC
MTALTVTMTPSRPSLQPPACEWCGSTANLRRCTGCKAIYYCSQSHRQSHHAAHRSACEAVGSALAGVVKEEIPFRASFFNGRHPTIPRHHLPEARRYTAARRWWILVLLEKFGQAGGRRHVVETALEHCLEVMREKQDDISELGRFVPSLLLRLGRDQEAYDFIKWYVAVEHGWGWGNSRLGYLGVKNADVLEYPAFEMENRLDTWPSLPSDLNYFMLSALILVKMRVLNELLDIQNTFRALNGFMVPEILGLVQSQLLTGALRSRPEILRRSTDDISALILQSKIHIMALFDAAEQHHPTSWRSMRGQRVANASPDPEADALCNRSSWLETHGALKTLNHAVELREKKCGYLKYEYIRNNGHKRLVAKEVATSALASS